MALYGFLKRDLPEHQHQIGLTLTVHNRCSECGHMLGFSLRLFLLRYLIRIDAFFGKTDHRFLHTLGLIPDKETSNDS